MTVAPIRTITLGVEEQHPLSAGIIQGAARQLRAVADTLSKAGYEVQTLRLSTRSLFVDLASFSASELRAYTRNLQSWLDEAGLAFCSLGTFPVADPSCPLERIELIPELLAPGPALNATILLATSDQGVRVEAALPTARVIRRLAAETEEGFGNFRFAMLACVEPGCPFFPSAYHQGPASLGLGLQGATLIARVLREATQRSASSQPLTAGELGALVHQALIDEVTPLVALVETLAAEQGLLFNGVDLSPAPLGEESIVAALESCGQGAFGEIGTLTLCAALTQALKATALPTCGYNGLMLPVLEDAQLGRRWEEGRIQTQQLLLYSTVCGTGLDTVPLPGDITDQEIARLLIDVATLAHRLRKPLSARLFPVPGRRAGEYTTFTSQYLTNTLIH